MNIPDYIKNWKAGDEVLIHHIEKQEDEWVKIINLDLDSRWITVGRIQENGSGYGMFCTVLFWSWYGTIWSAYDSAVPKNTN